MAESGTFSFSDSANITVLCTYKCVQLYTGSYAYSFKCDLPYVNKHACDEQPLLMSPPWLTFATGDVKL